MCSVGMVIMVTLCWLARGEHWFRYIVFIFRYISFVHEVLLLLPGWLCKVPLSLVVIMGDVIIVPISIGCYTRTSPGLGPCLSMCTARAVTIAFYDNPKTFWYRQGTQTFHNGMSSLPSESHEIRCAFCHERPSDWNIDMHGSACSKNGG